MIELPILWLSEEECERENMGLPTFFHINAIAPVIVNGKEYTNIYFNGDCVTATVPYDKVKRMIEEDNLPQLIIN